MKTLLSLILLTKLIYLTDQRQDIITTENYANSLILVEPDVYYLYWNYNATDIVCELHVKQTGVSWIGFGLSHTGGMHSSVLN